MDPMTILALSGALANVFGLFGKKKKTKGTQKQFLENIGFLNQLLGPGLQASAMGQARGQALAGERAAGQMRSAYARAGGFGSGALDAARALQQGNASVAYGVTLPQALYQGKFDQAQLAAQLAVGGGAQEGSMPQGAQSAQDILGMLGTYLLSRQGKGTGEYSGKAGASTGVAYDPRRQYFDPGISSPPPNLQGGR